MAIRRLSVGRYPKPPSASAGRVNPGPNGTFVEAGRPARRPQLGPQLSAIGLPSSSQPACGSAHAAGLLRLVPPASSRSCRSSGACSTRREASRMIFLGSLGASTLHDSHANPICSRRAQGNRRKQASVVRPPCKLSALRLAPVQRRLEASGHMRQQGGKP